MHNTFYDEICGYFKSTFILFFQVTKLIHLFILFFLTLINLLFIWTYFNWMPLNLSAQNGIRTYVYSLRIKDNKMSNWFKENDQK
jgi:hypothetical protein